MICVLCERNEVTSKNPEVDFCQWCYYGGTMIEQRIIPELMSELREASANSVVWHTGGGCFVVLVPLSLNPYASESEEGVFITLVEAFQDETDGTWFGEPGLPRDPSDDTKWFVTLWDHESWMGEKDPLEQAAPLTETEAIAWVKDKAEAVLA